MFCGGSDEVLLLLLLHLFYIFIVLRLFCFLRTSSRSLYLVYLFIFHQSYMLLVLNLFQEMIQISLRFLSAVPYYIMYICI